MARILDQLSYTKEHEWVQLLDEKTALVGITDFAQHSLGDIVYLELPEVGKTLVANKTFGVVESIKSVSDLYAPLSGKVVEVNKTLINAPEAINQDAYSSWMIKLEITQPHEVKSLLQSKDYDTFCAQL